MMRRLMLVIVVVLIASGMVFATAPTFAELLGGSSSGGTPSGGTSSLSSTPPQGWVKLGVDGKAIPKVVMRDVINENECPVGTQINCWFVNSEGNVKLRDKFGEHDKGFSPKAKEALQALKDGESLNGGQEKKLNDVVDVSGVSREVWVQYLKGHDVPTKYNSLIDSMGKDVGTKDVTEIRDGVSFKDGVLTSGTRFKFQDNFRIEIIDDFKVSLLDENGEYQLVILNTYATPIKTVELKGNNVIATYTKDGQEWVAINNDIKVPAGALGDISSINFGDTIGTEIPLQDGSTLNVKSESSGVTTVTKKKGDTSTITYHLADGKTLEGAEWTFDGTKFTNINDPTTSVLVEKGKEGNTVITETDDDITTTTTIRKDDGTKEIIKKEGGKYISDEMMDAEGNLLGRGILNDEKKIKEFHYFDKNGRIIGVCALECSEGDYLQNPENRWINDDGTKFCVGAKSTCLNEDGTFKPGVSLEPCNDDKPVCLAKDEELFWRFEKGWISTLAGRNQVSLFFGRIFGARGWNALSTYVFPELRQEWIKDASERFDQALSSSYVVDDEICDLDERSKGDETEAENYVFIRGISDAVQFAGSIQAEKTKHAGPALCSQNFTCDYGTCEDGVCRDTQGKPIPATFYKITWGVTSPRDEAYTVYIDESGQAEIAFNIKLYTGTEGKWLYQDKNSRAHSSVWKLKNGASKRDAIVEYSENTYNKVCIEFGQAPKDRKGDAVGSICATFKDMEEGTVPLKTRSNAPQSTPDEEVTRVDI